MAIFIEIDIETVPYAFDLIYLFWFIVTELGAIIMDKW